MVLLSYHGQKTSACNKKYPLQIQNGSCLLVPTLTPAKFKRQFFLAFAAWQHFTRIPVKCGWRLSKQSFLPVRARRAVMWRRSTELLHAGECGLSPCCTVRLRLTPRANTPFTGRIYVLKRTHARTRNTHPHDTSEEKAKNQQPTVKLMRCQQ